MGLDSDEESNTSIIEYYFQQLFAHLDTINSL
jgi:hypothetical protein